MFLRIVFVFAVFWGGMDLSFADQAVVESGSGGMSMPVESAGKVILMLFLVIGLILGFGWFAKRVNLGHLNPSDRMRVEATTLVGQKEKLILVRVDGQKLLIGVTSTGISTLHTFPIDSFGDENVSANQYSSTISNKQQSVSDIFAARASSTFSQYLEKITHGGVNNEK